MGDNPGPLSDVSSSLSSAHARVLAAHFKTMEEYCRQVDRSLNPFHGIYSELIDDIPEGSKPEIRRVLANVLERLAVIRGELGLERQRVSRRHLIEAYVSELWVCLMETKSRYLKAYGEVPEKLQHYLNPRVDEINELVRRLRRMVGGISEGNSE